MLFDAKRALIRLNSGLNALCLRLNARYLRMGDLQRLLKEAYTW
jgi:hypothetical protein